MEPNNGDGDNNVLLLKDMMLDEQEQHCVLEVYSEAPTDDHFIHLPGTHNLTANSYQIYSFTL